MLIRRTCFWKCLKTFVDMHIMQCLCQKRNKQVVKYAQVIFLHPGYVYNSYPWILLVLLILLIKVINMFNSDMHVNRINPLHPP